MCGIAGAIKNNISDIEQLEAGVLAMNVAQTLRGPDDEGIEVVSKNNAQTAILAQRRLSIIDLSPLGHQPMGYGEDLEITFNGEIYNFEEIKKELVEKGYSFKTKTDTEVILAGYKEWGTEVLKKMRGMFAFALYDNKKHELILARDRYGIKPLYYAKLEKGLVFASTVGAIKSSGLVNLTENINAKIGFLLFGSVPLPETSYKEISAVRAGHFLRFSVEKTEEVKYYDSLAPFLNKINPTKNEAVKKVRELLDESVRLHLISDAPLGVFLSGGVDSSVLAILAAEQRSNPIDTLSIDFKEQRFSEKKYREGVVRQIKSNHKEYLVGKEDFEKEKQDILNSMDEPTIDGVNTYFVSRAAKEDNLKVVLSGLGSDEIFFGYHTFKKTKIIRLIQRLPKVIKWPLRQLAGFSGSYSRLVYLYENSGLINFYLFLRGIHSPKEISNILKVEESLIWEYIRRLENNLPADLKKLNSADLLSWLEVNFYMANQLLKDTDFMSMRHSIEVRVPFLDHLLVEYVSSLSVSLKFGDKPKDLLISALGVDLPTEVWDRPKMGFTFPMAEWIERKTGDFKNHWSKTWARTILNSYDKKMAD